MVWLLPAGLFGLAALAGPILVHLLHRRPLRRTVFPSVRFVAAANHTSARLTRISDTGLLLIRVGIIASAAVALAQPLLLTDDKAAVWGKRVARVVIVDTSDSARGTIADEAIEAEASSADYVTRIDARDLAAAVKRAVAWLNAAPPARREIVVLSDFQHGAVTAEDTAAVPAEFGFRFVRTTGERPLPGVPAVRVLGGEGVVAAKAVLDGAKTAVAYSPDVAAAAGLQILAPPSDAAAVSTLLRIVARAGAAAPDAGHPIVIRFPGAPPAPSAVPDARDWTFGAAQRLLRAVQRSEVAVSVAASAGSLIVDVEADPRSLAAAQVVQAALDARHDPDALAEAETARIPDTILAAWERPTAPPEPAQWKGTADSDGRWLWALALVLLGAETLVRRASALRTREGKADAA